MSPHSEIVVVSGLPRSGTSLMMQMLERGGVPALVDHQREPDADNPHGYYEWEPAKKIKVDASWLPAARGKAVKMISMLLYDLPPTERYQVLFMRREMHEILDSQEKMLQRLGRPAAPRAEMSASYALHLDRLFDWAAQQPHLELLQVNFNELLCNCESEACRIADFLPGRLAPARMLSAVDFSLYRNRQATVNPR